VSPTISLAQGQGAWGQGYASELTKLVLLPIAVSIVLGVFLLALEAKKILLMVITLTGVLSVFIALSGGFGLLLVIFCGPWVLMALLLIGTIVAAVRHLPGRGQASQTASSITLKKYGPPCPTCHLPLDPRTNFVCKVCTKSPESSI
jgi:hypothetical protein